MERKIKLTDRVRDELIHHLYNMLSSIPKPHNRISPDSPVNGIIKRSAVQSSSVSAALSIPGGVAGIAAAVPDILAVWRIQSQMISNIAAAYGKDPLLSKEQMLWCMFRQMVVGVGKEIVVQQGSQYVVKRISQQATQGLLHRIGHGIIRSQGTKIASKVVPFAGSVTAGALTYFDTCRVGRNAAKLYSSDLILLPEKAA